LDTNFQRSFVWLGGGAFVASLAFVVYSYLFTWSTEGAFRPWSIAVNLALFALFAAHHSVFAQPRVKAWLTRLVPAHLVRSVYVWTASLLFIIVCAAWLPVGPELYRATGAAALVLGAVQLAGVGCVAASARVIDPLELAGIRPRARNEALQIKGPYRWVRHPIYLGWIVAVFGAAHMTGDRLLFAIVSSTYLLIAMPWEERTLQREFPLEYAAYRRQVRWRVVPYVY